MRTGSASATPRGTPFHRGRSPRVRSGTPGHPDRLSPKPNATFTTCLSIAVEGAVPIEDLEESTSAGPGASAPGEPPVTEGKRAPRKSKTEALAALQTHGHSSSPVDEVISFPDFGDHAYQRDGPPIPVSPTLDLTSVKTGGTRRVPRPVQPRPFGLEDCPTFYPSPEEFKDPMSYIKSISAEASLYGICKVVPPIGWTMPFVTDTESFRFKTRLQRLNSIEASSRAKVNFLEQLYRFHKQQGNPRVSVPTINHKPLDLWLLRKEVHKLGGYDAVMKAKKWADLGRILGYTGIPGLSTQIKNSYTRVILPYEHFCEHVRNSPSLSPNKAGFARTATDSPSSGKFNWSAYGTNGADDHSPPASPTSVTSSPLSEPPEDERKAIKSEHGRSRRSQRADSLSNSSHDMLPSLSINGLGFTNGKDAKKPSEQSCEVCLKKNRGEEMLLCDGCDCGFHIFCLDPPLEVIPKGQWFCHTCLFGTGGDFGFDEGEEHSLSSFQARDLAFRRMWFTSHPPQHQSNPEADDATANRFDDVVVSEYDVEEEFWRLVQSPHDTVEVEYGADVHSTTHGTAMPTLETHPLDPYAKDPWNLSNIPILPDSLLRFIKSDISGMTVPWTYVGMVFSTFCWHNEDHHTYSINFMHWGETKTWYGIPGEDAEKFEAAIKKEAPDLFEAQPDLLFQLVTLMNPQRLRDAGVRVYACNQRAGEFVITYPKAYHAGFNHGFNFNEAVNFALPNWLSFGLGCVERYREHRKLPVFSHDELLITITQQSQSIKTATWLLQSLREMTDREMKNRRHARSLDLGEVLEEEDRSEDQYQCAMCKAFCYLSQVTCQCTKDVVCVEHAEHLCQCPMNHRVLRKRFSDESLLDTLAKVEERAAVPNAWRNKLRKVLSESARPQLRHLRALLAEGDRINYPLSELAMLRKCVARANQWVDSANGFLVRKTSRSRGRRPRGSRLSSIDAGPNGLDEQGERSEKGINDLDALMREVDDLGFDCPEIGNLKSLSTQAEALRDRARALLNQVSARDRDSHVQECERLLLDGSSLNVHLQEMDEVEKIIAGDQLMKELEESVDDGATLDEVRDLLSRVEACDLPTEHEHVQYLKKREAKGQEWVEQATDLLARSSKTIEELDACLRVESTLTAIDRGVLDRLRAARARAEDYEKQAKAWLTADPSSLKLPVQDVMRVVSRADEEFAIPAVLELRRTAEFALDLESRCQSVMKNRYQHHEEGDLFEAMGKWKTYGKEHLTMFYLPQMEKLDGLLKLHYRWLESLPWYCMQHQEPHGKQLLEDVIDSTKPDDDLPPNDEYFTCICNNAVRPPAAGTQSDAVQCDHCYARFHGVCAATGRSCPFCDQRHWDGTMHKDRMWHFCYLPTILFSAPEISKHYSEDWKQLEVIVHRVDRLAGVIGQFLSFASQTGNQRPEYIPQVRHFMRKLYKIQFVVAPNPEVSYGMDLAGLHRILAGQPAPVRVTKKRRRPKFHFGQDVDKDWTDGTRCICRGRTGYLLNYPTVECETCNRVYHGGCVFFPIDQSNPERNRFICPLCCVRKGRLYAHAEVRVKDIESKDPDIYVDTQGMLDNFSKDILFCKLSPPYTKTLFIELVKFTPGQPDNVGVMILSSRSTEPIPPRPAVNPHQSSSHHRPAPVPALSPPSSSETSWVHPGRHVPAPPWANGRSNGNGAPAPPSASSRMLPAPASSAPVIPPMRSLPPLDSLSPMTQSSRKRKQPDESPPMSEDTRRRTAPHSPALSTSSERPPQTLSPSLAKVLSPFTDHRVSQRSLPPSPHVRNLGREEREHPLHPSLSHYSGSRMDQRESYMVDTSFRRSGAHHSPGDRRSPSPGRGVPKLKLFVRDPPPSASTLT